MFVIRTIIFAAVFYLIFNFSQIRSREFKFEAGSLIFPLSLSFALVLVDSFIRVAFFYAVILFIIIAALSYFLLRLIENKRI